MPIFIKKIKKNNFIKLILIFLILRSISSFITFKFLQFYDSRIFSFTDLAFYNDNDLDIFSPNFLYAYFVRSIGYNQETLLSFKFIFLSFLFSVISVLPYLFLSTKILSKKNSLFFIFILAFHPYLSLYSLKIDSNIFATFAIGFYSLWIFYSNNFTFNLSLLSNSFGVLLRNALIPFFWIQFILIVILKKKYFRNNLLLITSLFFLTLIISSSQFFYGIEYMSQNFGCYSYENINAFFSDFFNPYISNFISLISTPIIHLILNLGAREAISINCLNLPSEYVSNQFKKHVIEEANA